MASYNKVIMIGRLTRDPEKRYTSNGLALTNFSIAVDRPFKDPQSGEKKTDFFRCKAWRQKAEFVADYVQKGRLVAVEGRLETSESVGQDGQKRYYTDIVVDNVELLESTRDQAGPAASGGYNDRGAGGNDYDDDGYDEPAPARAPQRQERSAPAPQRQAAASAPAPRSAPPQRQAARPAPAQSAYPEDDFDDSDPFADE